MNSAPFLHAAIGRRDFGHFDSDPFAAETNSPREHLSLDANWKFHLGDDWPNALRLDKAGASGGPAAEKFSDNSWRTVNLPHDWAVELPFDKNADTQPRLQTGRAGLSQ